jgi:NitT/TauT family transport system permease protein
MASTAAPARSERTASPLSSLTRTAVKALTFLLVFASLWGLWEGYRYLGIKLGLTRPFPVNDLTMPHIHTMLKALGEPSRVNGPLLITVLLKSALFTAKEAAVGFALGASFGFVLAVVLSHSRLLQRGFLPYVIASQTVPILAIAPMVVIGLGKLNIAAWLSVAVISAFLTFFPVTINTLRGLQSADRRSLELMRSYAAGRWTVLWKLRVPASLPYLFSALKVSATASVVGAIVGELPSSIANGLGGAILNFAQYYSFEPQNLWATNIVAAALGIAFFLVIVAAERVFVRRAPEHVA